MATVIQHVTASMRKTCEGCGRAGQKTTKGLCLTCSAKNRRIRKADHMRVWKGREGLPPYFGMAHASVSATCCECGIDFVRVPSPGKTLQVQVKYCSRSCQKRASDRNRTRARRAKTRGAQAVEKVNVLAVFARDGWRCAMCGCKTPMSARGTIRANAPELDHIVPLSLGGDHSYANTQCLCRACNHAKGARAFGQMNLFPLP